MVKDPSGKNDLLESLEEVFLTDIAVLPGDEGLSYLDHNAAPLNNTT